MNPRPQVKSNHTDERREPRHKAQGVASVRPRDSRQDTWLQVQLVDVSDSGFRLSHVDTTFFAGQELDFTHPYATGTARVMWNRILNGRVETGCMILTRG